ATAASLNFPVALALDASGTMYIADAWDNRVRKVSANGVISTFAGSGTSGFSGDGGLATAAQFWSPERIAVRANRVYITDRGNRRLRMVDTNTGLITTTAGNGNCCYGGENISAQQSPFADLEGLGIDGAGNIYIGEYARIRKIDSGGIITTFAGNGS